MVKVLKGLACKTKIKFKSAQPNLYREREQQEEMSTAGQATRLSFFWPWRIGKFKGNFLWFSAQNFFEAKTCTAKPQFINGEDNSVTDMLKEKGITWWRLAVGLGKMLSGQEMSKGNQNKNNAKEIQILYCDKK